MSDEIFREHSRDVYAIIRALHDDDEKAMRLLVANGDAFQIVLGLASIASTFCEMAGYDIVEYANFQTAKLNNEDGAA